MPVAYYNRGNAYFDKRDYDRAIADFTQAIKLDPKDAFAIHDRGVAYYEKHDFERAIADFEAAIKINPNYAVADQSRAPTTCAASAATTATRWNWRRPIGQPDLRAGL